MTDNRKAYERAMILAAVCGSKIALGPTLLDAGRKKPSAKVWGMVALGEMVLDKLGVFPARYRPSLLIPHTLAGAYVAHESLKSEGIDNPAGAALGAAVAAGVAIALPLARITANRTLGVPDFLLGFVEDYVALKYGSEAAHLSLDEVKDVARDAVAEARHRISPALHAVGVEA